MGEGRKRDADADAGALADEGTWTELGDDVRPDLVETVPTYRGEGRNFG